MRQLTLGALMLAGAIAVSGQHAANALQILQTQTASFADQVTTLLRQPELTFDEYSGTDTLQEVDILVSGSIISSGTVTNTSP